MRPAMAVLSGKAASSFRFRDILYRKKDWVATITINRPDVYNAYSTRTLQEMQAAFKDATFDDGVAVIVLTGAGDKAFCTGGDVKEYADTYTRRPRDYWKYMLEFQAAHDLLRNCGKPTIARVNGVVAGGGNEFHIATDLSIAAEHPEFMPGGTRLGSVAAGGRGAPVAPARHGRPPRGGDGVDVRDDSSQEAPSAGPRGPGRPKGQTRRR